MAKWQTVVVGLVAGLVGGMLGSAWQGTGHAADSVYRAQRFELVRPDGRVAAVLGLKQDSSGVRPYLTLGSNVYLESDPFNGGNLELSSANTRSKLTLGNKVMAQTADHPLKSYAVIELDGFDGTPIWRAP